MTSVLRSCGLRLGCARATATTLLAAFVLAGCSRPMLAPTPLLTTEAGLDPWAAQPVAQSKTIEVLYATDRGVQEDAKPRYTSDRGHNLRLGVAAVTLGSEGMTWDDVHAASRELVRDQGVPVYLTKVNEIGILNASRWTLDPDRDTEESLREGQRFATLINTRLAAQGGGDVYIFVAPFKVSFEGAVFTAAGFHHFMGRRGVFIAYSWPTPGTNAGYLAATESAVYTSRNLRLLVEAIATQTDAAKIHLIGFSASARVVSAALRDLWLERHRTMSNEDIRDALRVGQVIFAGPDVDKDLIGSYLMDGMAQVPAATTIYTTRRDQALGLSSFLFGWQRLGAYTQQDMDPEFRKELDEVDGLHFVDVSKAQGVSRANFHGYFVQSEWVSTDVLLALQYGLTPTERGLVKQANGGTWEFPEDYRQRITAIAKELEAKPGGVPLEPQPIEGRQGGQSSAAGG